LIASRDASAASPPVAPAGRANGRDGRSAASGEAARLSSIREQLAAIEPGEWVIASARNPDGGDRLFIETTGPMGEISEIATFHADASTEEMQFAAGAPGNVRFLLGLVDRAIASAKRGSGRSPRADAGAPAQGQPQSGDPARERNYAAEAAMKCAEPAFKKFLMERHGLESPATDERAAQKLRSLLGVTSRAELNHDDDAAARWKALRADFENWKRAV
jgi:hypothetical protein